MLFELRIVHLPAAPGEKINHPHGAQWFDAAEARPVKAPETPISLQEEIDFVHRFIGAVGQQKPEVLYRRAHRHIVKVDQEQSLFEPIENIAAVTIAVNAYPL